MNIAIKKIFGEYFFFVFIAISLLAVLFLDIKLGMLFSIYMFLFLMKNGRIYIKIAKDDIFIYLFLIWSMISVIWYESSNYLLFVYSFMSSYLPACFYFYAKYREDIELEKIRRNIFLGIKLSMIIGVILYAIHPDFYGQFLLDRDMIPANNTYQIQKQFQGIFGVTATASFCAFLCLYELNIMLQHRGNNYLVLSSSMILLLLTARKSALIMLIVMLFVILLRDIIENMGLRKNVLLLFFMMVFIITVYAVALPEQFAFLVERFQLVAFSSGMIDRQQLSDLAFRNLDNIYMGMGLGTAGHRAAVENTLSTIAVAIFDNSYYLMVCEIGLVGVILFLVAVGNKLLVGMKRKMLMIEWQIVVIIMFQAITSNMFESIYVMPLFWYCLGVCANKKIIKEGYIDV